MRLPIATAICYVAVIPWIPRAVAQDSVIRVTVDLVQTDAVVTDSNGRHIEDLKPEDFEIFEDGVQQKITHFSYVKGAAAGSAALLPAGAKSTPSAAIIPPTPLQENQVRRTIILVADDLGLSAREIPRVRATMKDFVDRLMQPGDLVSIMKTSGGMGAMEQFTTDKNQLNAEIDRIHWTAAGRLGFTWYAAAPGSYDPAPLIGGDPGAAIKLANAQRLDAIRTPAVVVDTLSAVAYAVQGLREMPGRKAIVLFSDGFPAAAGGIVQLANRASVVIYTMDPRGLAIFTCAADMGDCSIADSHRHEAIFRASQTGLEQLAQGTGGIFFHDDNDLGKGLVNALDDMSDYYLLGYQPRRGDFDAVRGLPQFHKIEVKLRRAGLHVRSRNGFFGKPDPTAAPEAAAPDSARTALQKAMLSPFHANGFPVRLSAFYSALGKEAKTGHRPILLRAMLAIDARGLKFKSSPDGKEQLDLELVATAYGVNTNGEEKLVTTSDKTFTAAMTSEEMNQIITSGLVYGLDIELENPGPYQLRVAAWDANAEQVGSATTFVEIPDFNRSGVTLSTVQLSDSDPKRNEPLTRAGVMGAGSSVTRVFAPGAVLSYDCTVFGALPDHQTNKPSVDVEVHLFRGPEQIFTGKRIRLPIPDGNVPGAIHAKGEIKLPDTLPPGDYAVELVAYDRTQSTRSEQAKQFVDFTIAKADSTSDSSR
jgi:VWFA-related protein